MEERQMRRHIIMRNLRLWGGWALRTQIIYLLGTAIYTAIMYIFSSDNQRHSTYYVAIFYFMIMQLVGMLAHQSEYVNKQYPMALTFGSGRMESVWGMQLANAVFGGTSVLLFGILIVIERFVLGEEAIGIVNRAGWGILAYAGIVLLVLAVGQLIAASGLKNGTVDKVYLAAIIIFGIIIVGAVVTVMGWEVFLAFGIFDEEKQITRTMTNLTSWIFGGMGLLGVLLYLIGFFRIKKAVQVYEV